MELFELNISENRLMVGKISGFVLCGRVKKHVKASCFSDYVVDKLTLVLEACFEYAFCYGYITCDLTVYVFNKLIEIFSFKAVAVEISRTENVCIRICAS
jgi:hypothetical protein